MPYRTTDLRTAVNRAALFMSVGHLRHCVIYSHRAEHAYLVLDDTHLRELHQTLSQAGYTIAIDLLPYEIVQLTGPIQLSLLGDDVHAISQKDL